MTRRLALAAPVAGLVVLAWTGLARAENVDPDGDGSQYAYAENLGWINGEPLGDGGPGVQVEDFRVTGYLWNENAGWISLSCENGSICGDRPYGVVHDGDGQLAGHAWAENDGWISFSCENTSSCARVAYGVTIDPASGDFAGRAWGENTGWISFASTGPNPYRIKTAWNCSPPPPVPTGGVELHLERLGTQARLTWSAVAGATGFDVVTGDLATLVAGAGDYAAATGTCLGENLAGTAAAHAAAAAGGHWFLVRAANCGGSGSYDSAGGGQVAGRDREVAASGSDCQP